MKPAVLKTVRPERVSGDNEVRTIGYNDFPRRIDDDIPSCHGRPEQYLWMEHA